jgi:Lipase maturation factor
MAGATNALLMFLQWFLYLSFVHIGQLFYGYGWETMTLEAGFLAIFLCPVRGFRPNPDYPAPKIIIWFYRWMLFRVMFGAGLIKIRGDECWRGLTCLAYHYETQPLPNPISWYLHQMPLWFHQGGCLFNHFTELVVPWFYFAPRKLRHIAGVLTILFQLVLILSGNLSFLNWLTIAIAISCFDDTALSRVWRFNKRPAASASNGHGTALLQKLILSAVATLLIYLSIYPIRNMLSSQQMMNASFDRFHLMNTYGAFGSVSRVRYEIIIEGTNDQVPDDSAHWFEYEFLAKPGNPKRCPPFISPYQSRIDWQMWFASMSDYGHNPWLVHFVYKLLNGDPAAIGLLKGNPFQKAPPRFIRAELYEYHFTKDRSASGAWWERNRVGHYLPPLSVNDSDLHQFLQAYGWIN